MRLIDTDALILAIRDYADKKCAHGEIELANGILKTLSCINNAPTIEPDAKRGKWEMLAVPIPATEIYTVACSLCGVMSYPTDKFCPNCGADMRAQP